MTVRTNVLTAVLIKLKKYLEAEVITQEEVELAISEVELAIMNFCNIDEVPSGLTFTWVNLVVDLCVYNIEFNKSDEQVFDELLNNISNAEVGDTKVTLKGEDSTKGPRQQTLSAHTNKLDSFVMNYRDSLYKYRRLQW